MQDCGVIRTHIPMPQRVSDSHKNDYGRIGIIAGSRGMAGAGEMCTKACLRSGAGLVTIAAANCLTEVYEIKLTEAMVTSLPDVDGHLSAEAASKVVDFLSSKDAAVFGPGLGRSAEIEIILKEVLESFTGFLVIDADGLFALKNCLEQLDKTSARVLITPHIGEMSRLTGLGTEEIKSGRASVASEFAARHGVTVLLKDNVSVIASPDGRCAMNVAGNPGMARGGSGDVLAGVCGSFSARFKDLFSAACEAALVCGIAADMAADELGMEGMLPSDTIRYLGRAILEPAGPHTEGK